MPKNKAKSINKTLPRLVAVLLFALCILILPINLFLQIDLEHDRERESSAQIFAQVQQLIEENDKDLQREKTDFADLCIEKAELAAYFTAMDPQVASQVEASRILARKMDVDEIHFF